jgi:hypothetical protein
VRKLRDPALAAAGGLAIVAIVLLLGYVVELVRFAVARLPLSAATDGTSLLRTFWLGLGFAGHSVAVFAGLCVLAYLASWRNWSQHGGDWHKLVVARGLRNAKDAKPVTAPLGEVAVRIVAGFNIGLLSALAGLAVGQFLRAHISGWTWAIVLVAIAVGLLAHRLLTAKSPLQRPLHHHVAAWLLIVAASLLSSLPLALILVTGTIVSTAGRKVARVEQPGSSGELLRSPIPIAVLGVCAMLGLSWYSSPPIGFDRVTIAPAGEPVVLGGLIGRDSDGVDIVTCTPRYNATSTGERVSFVRTSDADAGRQSFWLDSGERPSLLRLVFGALGIDVKLGALLHIKLEGRHGTCANADPAHLSHGVENPQLGPGVIVDNAPAAPQAIDGEQPIEHEAALGKVAALARMYQPTLLVTVADRFWPVSVGTVLKDVARNGGRTCLVIASAPKGNCTHVTSMGEVFNRSHSPYDFLRYPAPLNDDPTDQFLVFARGQGIVPGSTDHWYGDPGVLNPWPTAEIYFYYAGPIDKGQWPRGLSKPGDIDGMIGLEYWFFYPFNYYATVVDRGLMPDAPIAGDRKNFDLHQGDWEHITILLDKSFKPVWLYTARHNAEGRFFRWGAPVLGSDHGHPVLQAAFGGHPTYPAGCGGQPRAVAAGASDDWLSCGSGRFAFRAATTPLVDLAQTDWGCWPGHFGEAGSGLATFTEFDTFLQAATGGQLRVAGPVSPLTQGENKSVACPHPATQEILAEPKIH